MNIATSGYSLNNLELWVEDMVGGGVVGKGHRILLCFNAGKIEGRRRRG